MQKYWNTVQDEHGNPRYGASVAVQQSGVNSTIYSDSSGLIPKTNPLTTDSTRGYFEFYAASGAYDLVVTGVGFASYTITNGAEVGLPSSDVSFIQSGTGAVAQDVQSVLRNMVWAEGFGFKTTATAAANATALGNIATKVNALGGATVVVAPGSYDIAPTVSGTVCALSGLKGFNLIAEGVTFNDTTVYTGTQSATLFAFTNCKNIKAKFVVVTQIAITTLAQNLRGLNVFTLLQGCKNVDVDLHITGGLRGLRAEKLSSDPASYSSSNIRGQVYATGCYYPYSTAFAGDNVDIQLDVDTCGRNFFITGNKNNTITVVSKNQMATSLIKVYEGYGIDTVKVNYTDRDSTTGNTAAPVISMEFGDSTANYIRNVELRVNLKNPSGAPWGSAIGWAKYSDGGGTADVTGRGHVLDGFKLSGVIDNTGVATNHFNMEAGAFASSDVQRNIVVENLTLLGTSSSFAMSLPTLSGTATFTNVVSNYQVLPANTTNGQVVFTNCKASNFTALTTNTDTHVYNDCEITDATFQNLTNNKTLKNTKVVVGKKNGVFLMRAEKMVSGDLTGTNNIFKIGNAKAQGAAARCRLKYYLVANQADIDPATRGETYGTKTFSLAINGSGVMAFVEPVAAEVTEQTTGTASVITVSLVNGDSTGGFVAVACTNYNTVNARAVFELETLAMHEYLVLTAV